MYQKIFSFYIGLNREHEWVATLDNIDLWYQKVTDNESVPKLLYNNDHTVNGDSNDDSDVILRPFKY